MKATLIFWVSQQACPRCKNRIQKPIYLLHFHQFLNPNHIMVSLLTETEPQAQQYSLNVTFLSFHLSDTMLTFLVMPDCMGTLNPNVISILFMQWRFWIPAWYNSFSTEVSFEAGKWVSHLKWDMLQFCFQTRLFCKLHEHYLKSNYVQLRLQTCAL